MTIVGRYGILVISLLRLSASFQLSRSRNNAIIRTVATNLASSNPLGSTELEIFHKAQWDLYLKNHAGYWKGIQTGYDPENQEVADFMYTEVNLAKNDQSTEITHTNSYVQGEIRSDCETCFDSERLKSKVVGIYSPGKLRSRLCGNVEIRGPGVTPNGISTEIVFRHGDGRIRVLLAHSAVDFMEIPGAGIVPSTFLLKDIVVVRERLNSRPYDLDVGPDAMWIPTPSTAFEGSYSGKRSRFTTTGSVKSDPVSFPFLSPCEVTTPEVAEMVKSNMEDNVIIREAAFVEPSEDMCRRVLKGGIMVEAPWIISADVEVRAKIWWKPDAGLTSSSDHGDILYSAEIGVNMSADDVIALPNGSARLAAPRLVDFFVDELVQSQLE
jgi:Domain of unknown function (DUF3598)